MVEATIPRDGTGHSQGWIYVPREARSVDEGLRQRGARCRTVWGAHPRPGRIQEVCSGLLRKQRRGCPVIHRPLEVTGLGGQDGREPPTAWLWLEQAGGSRPRKESLNSSATPKKNKVSGSQDGKTRAEDPTVAEAKSSSRGARRTTKRDSGEGTTQLDDFELRGDDSESDSAIEFPEETPKRGKAYDKALEFPHYWTEVLSPVTNKYLAVDAIVKSVIGTSRDKVELLEPRGGKADKAKQVMAYVLGFSTDGTAKDVTVRYLKRQMLPGRTKGFRMPVEKIPVYDRYGKVKRYEQFDWFKSVMRGYARSSKAHPFTEIDYSEDATDLKPAKAEKKEVKEGRKRCSITSSLKEFVLARHLKREEALLPTAARQDVQDQGKRVRNDRGACLLAEGRCPGEECRDVAQARTSTNTWGATTETSPYRAATTNRRREIAEAERATGEKVLQGLYSFDQTDWIIPTHRERDHPQERIREH